jgi:putative ABC transport system permease protein
LLRDLPYPGAERIVRLTGTRSGNVNHGGTIAYLNVRDVAARNTSVDAVSAYSEWRPNLTGVGDAALIPAALVNVEFFRVFGVEPELGRFFVPEEDIDGRDRVVVLSHGFWQSRLGGDPNVVGRTIELNGNPHTVVGVAGRDFEDPGLAATIIGAPELWRPLGYLGVPLEQQPNRGSSSFSAVARLRPGVTIERARDELDALSAALQREYAEQNDGVGMTAVVLRETIVGAVRSSLLLLLAAVMLVLAIAAANVGNLLLARTTERRQEMALRTALGASRGRIAMLVVTETLLLASAGGVLGLLLAFAGTRAVMRAGGQFVPREGAAVLDPVVLVFAILITVGAGLVCGLAPALASSAAEPGATLAEAVRGSSHGRRAARFRGLLIGWEVSLALVLLVGAGLLGKSLWRVMRVDVGIRTDNLLTFDLVVPAARYREPERVLAAYAEALARLERLPGVRSVAAINVVPLSGGFDCTEVTRPDRPVPPPAERLCVEVRTISPDYFATSGLALRRGRVLSGDDRSDSPPVAVVGETMVRQLWPDEDPLGKRVIVADTTVEVVGVAADVKHLRPEDPPPPMMYVAHAQRLYASQARIMSIMVRTASEPEAIVPAVRAELRALDERLPIGDFGTMAHIRAQSEAPPRFRTLLLGSFAALALMLATIGIYGVVSYTASRRAREIAIRMAVGARSTDVLRLVLHQGLRPVALGVIVGLAGAFALSRVLAAMLFQVDAFDTAVFFGVPLLLVGIATIATWIPARRITRVDPMTVLRED